MNNMPDYTPDYSGDDLSYMLSNSPSIDDYPDDYFFLDNNIDNPPPQMIEPDVDVVATPVVRNQGQQRLYKNKEKAVWVDGKKNQSYKASKSKKPFKNNSFQHKQTKKPKVNVEAEEQAQDNIEDEPTLLKSLKQKAEQIQDETARQAFEQKTVLAQSLLKNVLQFAESAPYATELRQHLDSYLVNDFDNEVDGQDNKDNKKDVEYEYQKEALPNKPFKIDDYSEPSHHYNLTDKLTYEALLPFMAKTMVAIRSSLKESAGKNALKDEHAVFAFQIMSQIQSLSEMYEPSKENEADLSEINDTIKSIETATQQPFNDFLKDEKMQKDFSDYLNDREFRKNIEAQKQNVDDPTDEVKQDDLKQNKPQQTEQAQVSTDDKNKILFDTLQRDIEQAKQSFHHKSNLQNVQESLQENFNEAKAEQDRANNQDMEVVLNVIKNSPKAKHSMVLNTLKLQNEYLSNPTAKNYKKAERNLRDVQDVVPNAKEYIATSNDKDIIKERERYIQLLQQNQNDTSDLIKNGQNKLLDNSLFQKAPKPQTTSAPSAGKSLGVGI